VVDGWTVRHDRAATVAHYQTVAHGDADRCGCSFCRNFALQRSTTFPADFLRLLERLGIDPAREAEVYEMGPAADGLRLYGGWFCFVGDFARTEEWPVAAFGAPRFDIGFTSSFPKPQGPHRDAMRAVEFSAPLLWLLPNESPD
jgi:hypothetical protein